MIDALALALLLGTAGAAAEPPPAASDPAATAPAGPAVDMALLAEVRRVAERVATLRSATFSKDPLALRAGEEQRRNASTARAAALLPSGRAQARGRAWADLGLGDSGTPAHLVDLIAADLPEVSLDLEGRRILVAPEALSDEDFAADKPDDPRATVFLATGVRPDEPLVAHALIHLLQRQRDVRAAARDTTTDGMVASSAWAEGEANFVAIRFLFQSMGIGDRIFEHDLDPTRVLEGRLVGTALEALPAVERSFLAFVHQEGFAQVVKLYRSGGWRAVEQASDARTATGAILHPDRSGTPPGFGPLTPPAAGLAVADEDRLGEQGVFALVSVRAGKDDLALVAADGWRGDRLVRWEPTDGGAPIQGVTMWESAWASTEEAKEFAYALGRVIEDGLAGAPLEDARTGRRSWRAAGNLYRLEQKDAQIRLRIAPVAIDERLEGPPPAAPKTPRPASR